MSRELSHVTQTVRLRFVKPNPTRASPYSSGSRCLNRWANCQRERSQGRAAMRGREEARQRYSGGRRVGLEGRASFLRFGEAWDRCLWRSPEETDTVNLFELLRWVAMSPGENGTLLVPVTIPRRLSASLRMRRVIPAYKVKRKGWSMRSAPSTRPLRSRLRDTSKGGVATHLGGESLNLNEQESSAEFMGKVSPALTATKWPDRDLPGQRCWLLRNILK